MTITDALQRITGVQINRDGGVGSSVDVRGLPQVGTMLNGEVFITPDQIDSPQPDFTTLPATLFNQVDVIKSPTAAQTLGGISGSINLHTFRPWDLPHGFTYSYSADGERGSTTSKTDRRRMASSHTTPMAHGGCRSPEIIPTPRDRATLAGPSRMEISARASTSMASSSMARTRPARALTTASWGPGTARRFLPRSLRIRMVVSM